MEEANPLPTSNVKITASTTKLDSPTRYHPNDAGEAKTGDCFNQKKGKKGEVVSEREGKRGKDEPKVPPVSIATLFRFTTKFELLLNLVGLIAAAAAGAAQPLLFLMFGNLTVAFVEFGQAIQQAMLNGESVVDSPTVTDTANHFKKTAAEGASYLACLGVGIFLATYIFMVTWIRTSEVAAKRIREAYLRSILRQDIAFFDDVGAGEIATRIQTDTHLVQLGVGEKIPVITSFLASFVAGFALAFARNWKLTLALSSMLPCIVIAGAVMVYFSSKFKLAILHHNAQAGTLSEEVIGTIRTVQAFGKQKAIVEKHAAHIEQSRIIDSKNAIIMGAIFAFFFFVIYASYALAFSFGATLVLRGEIDIGILVNVVFSIIIGSFSLVMIGPELAAVTSARSAAAKLFSTIDRVPPIDSSSPDGQRPDPSTLQGHIAFEGVRFNYPSRPDIAILNGINLDFPAGKVVALVGASGSGKSTIVALVERFYDPMTGIIRLDGIDIKDVNLRWLRGQIGLVSQNPVLFNTTIRQNVEHGLVGTPLEGLSIKDKMERVKEACVHANAHGFITGLPDGYDTHVGEQGILLSGGQKQRIAIARAIISDPRILLLDEATSSLDTQSEGVVQSALEKAIKGRTTIVIAHRLSTIKDASIIYVLGDGLVLECGTHEELLENENGAYARLVRAQNLKESDTESSLTEQLGTATPVGGEPSSGPEIVSHLKERKDFDKEKGIEEVATKEKPLKRGETSKSLASEILKQQVLRQTEKTERDCGLFYIMKRMAKINKNAWPLYTLGTFAAGCTGISHPVFGIVFANLMEDFQDIGYGLRAKADRAALWLFILAIVSGFSDGVQNSAFLQAAGYLSYKLRDLSFRAILRHDIAYFDEDEHSTGALTAGLSNNAEKISGLGGMTLGAIVQAFITLIGGSVIGLIYGWKLALVGIATIPFVISAGYVRLRVVTLKDRTNRLTHEKSAQVACEAAGAIKTVASLTREEDCLRIYSKSLEEPLRISNKSAFNSTFWFALTQSMAFFAIALVFWYGSRLVASLEYDINTFFICLITVTFGAIQAGNVFSFVPDVSESHVAGSEIVKLLDNRPEIDSESTGGKTLKGVAGKVEIKDVHFRYPTRPAIRVLRDFNLTVEPGTHIALVGRSGCGKSTIIQLIERFYDPLYGLIMVDGEDISKVNVQEYRKNLSLVSQEPALYSGSIRSNILLGATKPQEEITQEKIEAVCRDANILDFVTSLPNGFETEVGSNGSQLSGGQKQRIAIARALIRDPAILLLDEATSALDSNSEHVVQEALDKAAQGRTTISIAHRLATVQTCDKIHFMSDGKIVESGTHEELLHLKGKYYEHVLLQDLSGRC